MPQTQNRQQRDIIRSWGFYWRIVNEAIFKSFEFKQIRYWIFWLLRKYKTWKVSGIHSTHCRVENYRKVFRIPQWMLYICYITVSKNWILCFFFLFDIQTSGRPSITISTCNSFALLAQNRTHPRVPVKYLSYFSRYLQGSSCQVSHSRAWNTTDNIIETD